MRRILSILLTCGASAAYAADNPRNNADTFRPSAISGDVLAVGTTATGRDGLSALFGATWNEKPLKVTDAASGAEVRIVARQIALDIGAAWQFADRISVAAVLPVFALSDGSALPAELGLSQVGGASVGDLRLSARGVLLRASGFGLALREDVTVPTANRTDFTGDLGVTSTSLLVADWAHGDLRLSLNLGARLRKSVNVLGHDYGHAWLASAGAVVPLLPKLLELIGTLEARTALTAPFADAQDNVLDALGGARVHLGDFALTAAAGGGLASGFGSPAMRATILLAWAPQAAAVVAAPPPPPPAPADRDGDGVVDAADKCPDVAGQAAFAGCPPPDADGDGVLDAADKCPNAAGPAANAGCPADRDGDGVADALDKCPDAPGPKERNGCPEQRVVITKQKIVITDKIFFETGLDRIQKQSLGLLDEVAALLKKHPEIKKVRVEGHTDNVGDAAVNLKLSGVRALAVRKYLVSKGIAEARLTSAGVGDQRPIGDNTTEEGRAQNRRVEFMLVGPGD